MQLSFIAIKYIFYVYGLIGVIKLLLFYGRFLSSVIRVGLSALAATVATFLCLQEGLSFYYSLGGTTWLWWEPVMAFAFPHLFATILLSLCGGAIGGISAFYLDKA